MVVPYETSSLECIENKKNIDPFSKILKNNDLKIHDKALLYNNKLSRHVRNYLTNESTSHKNLEDTYNEDISGENYFEKSSTDDLTKKSTENQNNILSKPDLNPPKIIKSNAFKASKRKLDDSFNSKSFINTSLRKFDKKKPKNNFFLSEDDKDEITDEEMETENAEEKYLSSNDDEPSSELNNLEKKDKKSNKKVQFSDRHANNTRSKVNINLRKNLLNAYNHLTNIENEQINQIGQNIFKWKKYFNK